VPAVIRIWGVASPLVHHPCIGGCWIRKPMVVLVAGLVVVESLSSLGQAFFRLFSRQIWQPSRWRCGVSLQRWRWRSLVDCFGLRHALVLSLWRGVHDPFGAVVLGASMVGGLDRHREPTTKTTLVVWQSLGVPASMGRT
jgi:hypothetical protein